jgi:hypothetical protein
LTNNSLLRRIERLERSVGINDSNDNLLTVHEWRILRSAQIEGRTPDPKLVAKRNRGFNALQPEIQQWWVNRRPIEEQLAEAELVSCEYK